MIQNCPIIASDFSNAHIRFGKNLSGTRGNTVIQNPDRLVMNYFAVPKDFLKLHKFVTLVADVMFVNSTQFLITMSRGIKFVTDKHIPNRTAK